MLALVERAQPGPCGDRTIELGTYLGIRDEGVLVAMAGVRMHPPGYTEISAVCTDDALPRHAGSRPLVRRLVGEITARGETPCLHAVITNITAIRLYEKLGFTLRRESPSRLRPRLTALGTLALISVPRSRVVEGAEGVGRAVPLLVRGADGVGHPAGEVVQLHDLGQQRPADVVVGEVRHAAAVAVRHRLPARARPPGAPTRSSPRPTRRDGARRPGRRRALRGTATAVVVRRDQLDLQVARSWRRRCSAPDPTRPRGARTPASAARGMARNGPTPSEAHHSTAGSSSSTTYAHCRIGPHRASGPGRVEWGARRGSWHDRGSTCSGEKDPAVSNPYEDRFPVNHTLPEQGRPREEILAELDAMAKEEDAFWETGKCSGTMYCGDHEHYAFMNDAFGKFAHVNALQRDMCPSQTKFEGEIIAMTLDLFHAEAITGTEPVGLVTTGGTGSILHAMIAYREQGAARGIKQPNVVKPETAHPAFDKGCHLFGIEVRNAEVDQKTYQVDLDSVASLIDENTVALVGSACNYGYGTIDPIEELSDLALQHNIGLHVDGCLGGWILPFGQELGWDIPNFDFRVPGVTSISADTHKYGYAFKGTSVLAFRDKALRNGQYFFLTAWSGGKYCSPGIEGSRSGGLLAATWAALVSLGREGYRKYARRSSRPPTR